MSRMLDSIGSRIAGVHRNPVLIMVGFWLVFSAGWRPLTLPDEGRYVGVAWEMLANDQWLLPTLDGMPYFHKPPLFYWLTMLGLKLFGANMWAARFASLCAALLMLVATYFFAERHVGRRYANLCAVILATQPFFFVGGQFANLDMLVASLISMSILCGVEAVLRLKQGLPYRRYLAGAYIFAALGVLAKGLIGVLLPGAILLAWIVLRKQLRLIPALVPLGFVLLFLAISMPWFVWMERLYPGFLDYFFIYHHFRRFSETGFNNPQPFWFYVPVLLALTLPWSFWLLRLPRLKGWFSTDSGMLVLVWIAGILLFFSIPRSKLIGYILPALPALTLAIAKIVDACRERHAEVNTVRATSLSLILGAMISIGTIAVANHHDNQRRQAIPAAAKDMVMASDQLVMLGEYRYDLPFYLGLAKPAWVVDNWDDPEIKKKDNWRKELYDASEFDGHRKQASLISENELQSRICASSGMRFWVWGNQETTSGHPFLSGIEPISRANGKTLFLLNHALIHSRLPCREMPTSGW